MEIRHYDSHTLKRPSADFSPHRLHLPAEQLPEATTYLDVFAGYTKVHRPWT
jgi:hypothetical protein